MGGGAEGGASVVRAEGGLVLCLADQDVDEKLELYSVAPTGGTPVKLNPTINDISDVLPDGLAFSPDGSRVIFQVDRRPEVRTELYSVSSLGGTAGALNPFFPVGGGGPGGGQRGGAHR